jgi:serine/threonine-protein phosphatase 2A regulatory subunit A
MEVNSSLHPVEVLIEELKCEDLSRRIQSVRSLNTIAIALGPKQTRDELLPYLLELLDDENEVLIALADSLKHLIQSIGGSKYTFILFDLIEQLLQIDESQVRKATLSSFQSIIQSKSQHLMKAVLDLNKRLVASDKIPAKIAAAHLIPCSIQHQSDIKPYIDQFKILLLCSHPQVRTAAGENLKNLVKFEDFIAELLNIATVDQEETVRLLALDALLMCGNVKGLITSIIALFEDDFWRVKQKICENIEIVSKFLCGRFELLLEYFKRVIEDKEIEVRLAICGNIGQVFKIIPKNDISGYVSALNVLANDSTSVKVAFSQHFNNIWSYTGRQESLVGLLKDFTSSYNSKIFINLLKDIQQFQAVVPENEEIVKDILENLAKDKSWRVRQNFLLNFIELCTAENSFFDQFLKGFLIDFCVDSAFSVRETACEVLCGLLQKMGREWFVKNFVEELFGLQYSCTYIPRMSFLKIIREIYKEFVGTKVEEKIEKAIFYLLGDSVGNVRAYALLALLQVYNSSSEEKQVIILNSLTLIEQDEDSQVRKLKTELFK